MIYSEQHLERLPYCRAISLPVLPQPRLIHRIAVANPERKSGSTPSHFFRLFHAYRPHTGF